MSNEPDYKKGGFEYNRYIISKGNGDRVDPDAQYFVLRIDKDPHAMYAAMAYADSVEIDNPKFARQLRSRIRQYKKLMIALAKHKKGK